MIIKNFSENYLRSAAKLCRQNMEFDIMPDFLLREKTFGDPDFNSDLTLLYFKDENEEPVAFIQGVIRKRENQKIGYVKLLCVDSNERRKGIATDLYKNIEEKFRKENVKVVRVYESYPNYFMPGVDPFYTEAVCFFERHRFKKFSDTSNLTADLLSQNFDSQKDEEKLKDEDIICRRAEQNDKDKILSWVGKNFPVWTYEVSESVKNNPITLFITEMKGEVKAFSAHEANNKGTGWFGPMGTDESLRGKGVGGILLRKSLLDMKNMGFVKAVIPWVGPIPFYMHYANAKVDRVFWRYEKILE